MDKKKSKPGMSDAENVFDVIEEQEKEERRKQWLEENKPKSESKEGDKKDSKSWG